MGLAEVTDDKLKWSVYLKCRIEQQEFFFRPDAAFLQTTKMGRQTEKKEKKIPASGGPDVGRNPIQGIAAPAVDCIPVDGGEMNNKQVHLNSGKTA